MESPNLLASHAGVIRGVGFLPFPSSSSPVSPLAWDQAPHWGVKVKVIGVGEKNRRVRFACRYFSYLAPFFCFRLLRIAPLRSLVPGYSSLSLFFFFRFQDGRRDHIQWNPAITKCQGTEKIVGYSGIAKTPL